MIQFTEQEVAVVASYMGYELVRVPEGYFLMRDYRNETELVQAHSLEHIAEFLKH
jgi:hypothetical protein